ncbi:MAG: diaminopimelate dehydrogenase [Oscillospiraceae bacterium]|jgi:diaminopimelate dehydrogenase|nr:diaminopimelate dehydrogenase [Oscillospiraceae bacterium]
MANTINACIVGWGNVGKAVLEALRASEDFRLCGLIRRSVPDQLPPELSGVEVASEVSRLSQRPDVAILCTPSRSVPEVAPLYLSQGINTVDSYDIHTTIYEVRQKLEQAAKAGNAAAILSAGWDPGSDSVVRALMQSCAPEGITYTNFGPGMSMGHTVAVKAVEGVRAALSMTIPLGTGIHRRMVYVELEPGADYQEVAGRIKADPYFVHDETHVIAVEDVNALIDMGHGVEMTRKGVSGAAHNQRLSFFMSINNPALTAQNLVNAARASMKQAPGAYTMIEIPVIDLLPGDRETLIRQLV